MANISLGAHAWILCPNPTPETVSKASMLFVEVSVKLILACLQECQPLYICTVYFRESRMQERKAVLPHVSFKGKGTKL